MILQGETINAEQNKVIRFLQEALGSVRDMILDNSQVTYSQLYRNSDTPLAYYRGNGNDYFFFNCFIFSHCIK